MNFKIGDVVRLKSGGPKMTVGDAWDGDPPRVKCAWFERDSEALREKVFESEMLVKV